MPERAHRCFGFVTYEKEVSALNAIDNMHNNVLPKQSQILKVISATKPKGATTAGTNKPSTSAFTRHRSALLTLHLRQSGPTRSGSKRTERRFRLRFQQNEILHCCPISSFLFTPLHQSDTLRRHIRPYHEDARERCRSNLLISI